MSLSGILGGFKTLQKHFFEIFGTKKQKEKKNEKIEKNRKNEISVEISYRSPPITDISAEISEILFPDYRSIHSFIFASVVAY